MNAAPDVTHTEIVARIAALETRVDLNFKHISEELHDIKSLAASARGEGFRGREKILDRVRRLESRVQLDDQLSERMKEQTNLWRGRLYAVIRYVAPPSAAAALVAWLIERN